MFYEIKIRRHMHSPAAGVHGVHGLGFSFIWQCSWGAVVNDSLLRVKNRFPFSRLPEDRISRFPEDKWSDSKRIDRVSRFPCPVSQRVSRIPEDKWSDSQKDKCPDSQRIKSFPEDRISRFPENKVSLLPEHRMSRFPDNRNVPSPLKHFEMSQFPIVPFPRIYKCRYF